MEQPGCIAWEPAFAQDLEWCFLHAMDRVGVAGGTSSYFRLSTRPLDPTLAALPDDPARWPADPHELLGVPRDVNPRDLRRAYTKLIRAYKPEQFPEQFRRIRAAYEAALRLAEFFGAARGLATELPEPASLSRERPEAFDPAEDANALFQVISQRYLRGSIILTTNRGVGAWGDIFADTTIAAGMLDRLLHRSVVINITGDSYRIRTHRAAARQLTASTPT